jgi:protein-tyrosine phosphatase
VSDSVTVRGRDITWGGFHNARDLGGLPARDGRIVQPRRLIRSGDLRFVTAEGWRAAYEAGVRTVVDLRNDDEIWPADGLSLAALVGTNRFAPEADGPSAPPGMRRVHVALDGVEDVAFWRYLTDELLDGSPLYYRPFLEKKPERVVAVLTAIARAQPGGVIVHCVAGRDRTGLVALLLLALVGVDAEAIADDYELTAEPLRALFARLGRGPGDLDDVERALASRGTTVRGAIRATLAGLDVEAYLLRAGMTPADLGRLRGRLLA